MDDAELAHKFFRVFRTYANRTIQGQPGQPPPGQYGGAPPQQYGGGPPQQYGGAPQQVQGSPAEVAAYKQLLQSCIQEKQLHTFYPPNSPIIDQIAQRAPSLINQVI